MIEALAADPRPRSMNRWSASSGRSSSRASPSPTSPGRSTSRRRPTSSRDTDPAWFLLAVAIMVGTAMPMALRWQWLLAARGMQDTFWWLTRAYFVSYTASQVLPTSIGGDAVRVVETSRRHPGRVGDLTAIVLLERGLGGAATVLLGAIGFALALGRYDVGAYLWLELLFVVGTIVVGVLFFSRSVRPLLARSAPLLAPPAARPAAARVLRGRPCLPLARPAARQCLRADVHAAGDPRVGDLGDGEGGRHRPLAARLLRDGAAVLPRPARPVHAERLRRARGVLRQLPRPARRRRRPGVRGGLPLLPRHRRDGAARRRDPALGGAAEPPRRDAMRDSSVVVVTYNALPWIEQSLESVRGEETIVVDNGSTGRDARRRPRALPRGARARAREPGSRRRLERRDARSPRDATSCS